MAEELIISGDADHGGIVGDEFLGVGEVDGEIVFAGDRASEVAERYVTDDSAS